MQKITVVSLGQRDESQLTLGALKALEGGRKIVLRTGQHGAAAYLKEHGIAFETLDSLYEQSFDFNELNQRVKDYLLGLNSPLVYAVADATSDATVSALIADGRTSVTVLPGVSAAADMMAQSRAQTGGAYRVLPAIDTPNAMPDPRTPLIITELNSRVLAGQVKLWLLSLYPPEGRCMFMHLGQVSTPLIEDVDRQKAYNHTSCLYIPPASMMDRSRHDLADLCEVMAILRGQNGCPWDKEQTHQTLTQYLVEEAYETIAAIDQCDPERVYDELGDVLLQVVFHTQIAKEHGEFDITDVTSAIVNKMISRHAHIFGTDQCQTAQEVLDNWEKIKKKEKGIKSYTGLMNDIPAGFPALMRAGKVQAKAAQVGFDFDNPHDALKKVYEESQELEKEIAAGKDPGEEMGDLLFSCVNTARKLGLAPELCLQEATEKFIKRFSYMEKEILSEGKSLEGLTLSEMDVYWERGKNAQK